MKRTSKISAAVFLSAIFLIVSVGLQADESNDEMLIREAVTELYIKGLQIRDFKLIRDICIPETVLMSTGGDNKLHVTSLDTWSKRFDPDNPPFQSLDYSILRIDTVGSAAQVKILFIVDGDSKVTDFLHLLKLEGRWRVVNIIDF